MAATDRTPPQPGGDEPGGAGPSGDGAARPRWQAIEQAFDLRLLIPADPAALGIARQAVGGIAQGLGMGPPRVADVRLAVTEVCTACLRHAAADGGELELRCDLRDGALQLTVRDGQAPAAPGSPDGFPLPLVAALTDSVELRRLKVGGTEVAMSFRLADAD